MSIGAGRPKLRIWLHHVGRLEEEDAGPGTAGRQLLPDPGHVVPRRPLPIRLERHQDLRVREPIVAGSAYAIVEPLVAMPMLSSMLSRILRRDHPAQLVRRSPATIVSVASSRVPDGGPDVEPELAGVDLREEILSGQEIERRGGRAGSG
jgi:hypothetical protein